MGLYDLLRCGFAHDAMFRTGISFTTLRKEPFLVTMRKKEGAFDTSAPLESIIINPKLFVEGIDRHFTSYVRELKRGADAQVKSNFEGAVAIKWRLGQPGPHVAMTEQQFMSGELPGEA